MTEFYPPDTSGQRHLLVYLHGHGSAPEMVHPFFRQHHDDGWLRVCPQAPIATDGGWSWFDNGSRGVDRASLDRAVASVRTLIDAATGELGLDWSDVVVGGFSQGAATALALGAAVAVDGHPLRGLLLQAGFAPEVFDDEVDIAAIRAGSVLVQHGAEDEVVPSFMAKDLAETIGATSDHRPDVEVEVLPGGHALSTAMLDGARRWLQESLR